MSVYVDELFECGPTTAWKWRHACHLFADTERELHAFAVRIALRREWFQPGKNGSFPHYDLTAGKRQAAVAMGAREVDRAFVVAFKRRIAAENSAARATGTLF